MTKKLYLEFETSLYGLAEQIIHNFQMSATLTHEDIANLFMAVDDLMSDWVFTRAVYERFAREMSKLPAEEG